MSFAIEMLLVAAGTFMLRSSVIALAGHRQVPDRAQAVLRLIPAAVLPALVANSLFVQGHDVRPFGPWYVAAALATLVAVRTRSTGWTLLVGMVSVWVLVAVW
jgi:branched-subunit amino acid transport protein